MPDSRALNRKKGCSGHGSYCLSRKLNAEKQVSKPTWQIHQASSHDHMAPLQSAFRAKDVLKPGVSTHTWNLSTQEAEAEWPP